MNFAENPEIQKELARESLRKIAETVSGIPEDIQIDAGVQEELDRLHQQYYDLTGEALTEDRIVEAIDALAEE